MDEPVMEEVEPRRDVGAEMARKGGSAKLTA